MAKQEQQKPLVRVDGRDPKQCRWTFYRSSGAGGQHRNKTSTAARVLHLPSGAMAQASEHKSQPQNKKAAWERLGKNATFRAWLRRESSRASGELDRIEREVTKAMRPHNIKVERRNEDGAWEVWQRADWTEGTDA